MKAKAILNFLAVTFIFLIIAGCSGSSPVDDSDPTTVFNLVEVTPKGLTWPPRDVYVDGIYAYIPSDGLSIVDVSDPSNPQVVKDVDTSGEAMDVVVSGGYAYVTCWDYGLDIIDIDPPVNAHVVKTIDGGFVLNWRQLYFYGIQVEDGYAFVSDGKWGQLIIIDIDPIIEAHAINIVAGNITPSSGSSGLYIGQGYAYMAQGGEGLTIVDVEPLLEAHIVGTVDTPGFADSVILHEGYAYIADLDGGLQIVDVNSPTDPYILASIDTEVFAEGLDISGTYAFVANADAGLQIIDISDPSFPYTVGKVYLPGYANRVAVAGAYAYVADFYAGLQIVSVNNPSAAYNVGASECIWPSNGGMGISGQHAVLPFNGWRSNYWYSLVTILDISDPSQSTIRKVFYPQDIAYDIQLINGYAYIADGIAGLTIADVDPPEKTYIVNTITPDYEYGCSYGVAVAEGYAYVSDGSAGLQIISIDPPEQGHLEKNVPIDGTAFGIVVSGQYAYIVTGEISNVDKRPLAIADLFVSDGYAYILYDLHFILQNIPKFCLLWIIDISHPEMAYVVKHVIVNEFEWGDHGGGFTIVDVEPVASAQVIKKVGLAGGNFLWGIAIIDGYAFISGDSYGPSSIDVYDVDPVDKAHWTEKHEFQERGLGELLISDGYLYMGLSDRVNDIIWQSWDGGAGLRAFRLSY